MLNCRIIAFTYTPFIDKIHVKWDKTHKNRRFHNIY